MAEDVNETAIFPPGVKPCRVGVYPAEHPLGLETGFAFWHGTHWGWWARSIEAAEQFAHLKSANQETMRWWGLTRRGYLYELAKLRRRECGLSG